jgi:hypothetical protein
MKLQVQPRIDGTSEILTDSGELICTAPNDWVDGIVVALGGKVEAPSSETQYSESFERFWKAYPRKEAKAYAYRCFLRQKAPLATIIAGIDRHLQTENWKKDGGKFIPHPATFLSQKRWEDDLGEQVKARPDWRIMADLRREEESLSEQLREQWQRDANPELLAKWKKVKENIAAIEIGKT